MAVSLGAGILFLTVITLYLIPCALLLSEDMGNALPASGIGAFGHLLLPGIAARLNGGFLPNRAADTLEAADFR